MSERKDGAMHHEGDPCRHCGQAHDDVAVGPCPGRGDGGPAFPRMGGTAVGPNAAEWVPPQSGMSLRDYFAAHVAQGLAVGCSGMLGKEFSAYAKGDCNAVIAERAYTLADALLSARVKP